MIPFKIDKKTLTLHQYIIIMFIFSIIFSIYYLTKSANSLSEYIYQVIAIEKGPIINYSICSIFYIIVLIIASSSYLGIPIISLSITYRFLVLVYSLFHIGNFTFMNVIAYIIPQVVIELILTYIMTYMSLQLTLQTLKLSFFHKGNYNTKILLNYILSYVLVSVLLIFLSCIIKIYLV